MSKALWVIVGLYCLMGAAACLWGGLRGPPWLLRPGPTSMGLLPAAGWGLGLGMISVLLTRVALRWSRRMRVLGLKMGRLLGPMGGPCILMLAASSALAEELFFRGAMQPSLGFVLSSLLFGVLHIGPDRSFWPWTIFALVLGFALGGLLLLTGSLLAPILAHFTINYFNLHQIEGLRVGE